MATEVTETCPYCQGTPQHPAIICGPDGCRQTVHTCDFCGGSGIVASEAAARYRKGHALREHRVRKLRLTQKQLAALLGTSLIFLNDVEHGRADMPERQWRRFEEISRELA
jgi:16S rRNA G966 N2-methylase RsmD